LKAGLIFLMSESKYKYGEEGKKIVFQDSDKRHADLRIRLRYDGLTQLQFFRAMVTGYLTRDSRILGYVNELKEAVAKQGKKKLEKSKGLDMAGKKTEKLFNLSEKEAEDLFDLIAKELPDL
jgi:hypothetical protein